MAIKFTPNLQSLEDFLPVIESWIPQGKKLTKIYECYAHPDKKDQFYANINTYDHVNFTIGVYLYRYRLERVKPLERVKRRYSTIDILIHLAHEISHLYEWEHTPQRQIIESQITVDLMIRAIELGYVSEEVELKTKKPDFKKTYSISRD